MRHFKITEPIETMLATLTEALDCGDVGILLLDRALRVRYVNDRMIELFGYPPELLASKPCYRDLIVFAGADGRLTVPPEHLEDFADERVEAVRNGSAGPTRIEFANGLCVRFCCRTCANDGRILTYTDISEELRREAEDAKEQATAELRFNTELLEDQGAYLASLAEAADENARQAEKARQELENEIIQRRRLETELRRLATTDGLTGILNRPAFLAASQEVMQRVCGDGQTVGVMMLDVDHFKAINDQYGHAGGDFALQSLTQTLRSGLREGDLFGRLGGEEFAILLHTGTPGFSEIVAERLRSDVEAAGVAFGDGVIRMTMSVGLAVRQATDHSIEQILARADAALYRAKRSGRNRVVKDLPAVLA